MSELFRRCGLTVVRCCGGDAEGCSGGGGVAGGSGVSGDAVAGGWPGRFSYELLVQQDLDDGLYHEPGEEAAGELRLQVGGGRLQAGEGGGGSALAAPHAACAQRHAACTRRLRATPCRWHMTPAYLVSLQQRCLLAVLPVCHSARGPLCPHISRPPTPPPPSYSPLPGLRMPDQRHRGARMGDHPKPAAGGQ